MTDERFYVNQAAARKATDAGYDEVRAMFSRARKLSGNAAYNLRTEAAAKRATLDRDFVAILNGRPPEPAFVDVATVSEYGLTQKLSSSIRCF